MFGVTGFGDLCLLRHGQEDKRDLNSWDVSEGVHRESKSPHHRRTTRVVVHMRVR